VYTGRLAEAAEQRERCGLAVYITSCPRNCYSTCTLEVHVEDGRIRRIEPHAGNKATPEGGCLKGLSYVERQQSPQRILHPFKRTPGTNAFVRISWDEAFASLVERLQTLKREWGPQSILYYASSGTKGLLNGVGMSFWRLFGGCTTTYGDLCWPAGLEATRLTLGENKHNAPWDIANARLIILWGKNAAETNIHQMVFIEEALRRGGRLVVIDPRRTESAERAELLVQPRPGTDGILALAVARLLIEHGHVDTEFVEKHISGFDAFERMVMDVTVEVAADIADVPASQIHRLAELIGTVKPVTINCGYGMQRYTNSGQTMRSILSLLCITGNIGKPGAGWVFANLKSDIFSAVQDPIAFYAPEKPDGVVRVSISTARLGPDMLSANDPPLKMIWVERGNPVTQNPETHAVLEAFRGLEFRVVVEQFMTDTAREADIILPAKTLFEQTDVINAYWHDYIQIKRKVLEPAGEVKPETVIYHELARRLGFSADETSELIPGPSDAEIEDYLQRKLDPHGLTLEQLKEGPVPAPGHEDVAFVDFAFPTPSGRIELYSKEATERWGLNPLPVYTEPVESIRGDTEATRPYPLHLMTPNTKNRIHSQFNNLDMIRAMSPKPTIAMNPQDAADRNIGGGDLVRVYNDRGELRLEASIDHSLKTGCVVITNGWWATDGASVNMLSKARETDMGFGAAFHDNLVDVEPAR